MTRTTQRTVFLALTLIGLPLAGCDPERNTLKIVVQADGSASIRVVHDTAGRPDALEESSERRAARAPLEASLFMTGWAGVKTWSEVTARPIECGRTRVEATAWLPQLRDLRVRGTQRFDVRVEGDLLELRYLDPVPEGMKAIFLEDERKVLAALTQPEERFDADIDEMREQIGLTLASWSFDLSVRLPGSVDSVDGLVEEPDGRVILHQDVLTLLAHAERHITAMRDVRRQVAEGLAAEQGYVKLVRLADEANAAAAARVRCRLPLDLPPPAGFHARQVRRSEVPALRGLTRGGLADALAVSPDAMRIVDRLGGEQLPRIR